MTKFLRAAAVLAVITLGASVAQSQTVVMGGEYHEGNGIIVNIPQNPPTESCVYGNATNMINDARCFRNFQFFNDTAMTVQNTPIYNRPNVGVTGYTTAMGGLNVGDPFTVPTLAFSQMKGTQVGIVLNNITKQLDTNFSAAAPGSVRSQVGATTMTFQIPSTMITISTMNTPNGGTSMTTMFSVTFISVTQMFNNYTNTAGTRMFSQMNWSVPGSVGGMQNNAHLSTVPGGAPAAISRQAADTTITAMLGGEQLTMTYSSGAREFGGTMTVLLDGTGRLYLNGPGLSGNFPTSLQPIIGTNPVGDGFNGFAVRNAAGWDYTVVGSQMAGRIKAFFGQTLTPNGEPIIGPPCAITPPPTPEGCNVVNGFETNGVVVAALPNANSTKHMFAWTTGTVQIIRAAFRPNQGGQLTDTVTGMGYDTVGVTAQGNNPQRNVGLVAGSYTFRKDGTPLPAQLNTQIVGINLRMAPEPGATVALLSGLGLVGALAVRRRRS